MAHRILGIDLGAYSVKVAVLAAGFRKVTVVDFLERRVPDGPEPLEQRAAAALGALTAGRGFDHDVPHAALGGEALSMRVLDFAFQGLKRVDLDKAVGSELEAQLPHELDDIVYAFDVLPRAAAPAEGEARPPAPGTRVLAAATTRARVQELLDSTAAYKLEPHAVLAAPTAYGRVAAHLEGAAGPDDVMLIDHGHARTNVAVLRGGKLLYARTIGRGGKNVTQAIARAWGMSFADAEKAKHSDGFVASSREPAPSEAWSRISEVVKVELTPLVRELRQTLAACRAQTGAVVTRAVLAGGGARLRGLGGFLGDALELPVTLVSADDAVRLLGVPLANRNVPADLALLALGAAFEGASGRPSFDLRQGPLAYKHDFTFLRAKVGVLAACALLLIAFLAGDAYASLYRLRAQQEVLEKRLAASTTEIFGAPVSAADLEAKLAHRKDESPLPHLTAFDLLVEISKKLPPKTEVKIDVTELKIEPTKIFMKGVADSRASVDVVVGKLKEIDCFTDVTKGSVVSVNDGQQFTLTIAMKCM
jgi:type IV pilus assembly protein PilM